MAKISRPHNGHLVHRARAPDRLCRSNRWIPEASRGALPLGDNQVSEWAGSRDRFRLLAEVDADDPYATKAATNAPFT
jgi:hypothetical protein